MKHHGLLMMTAMPPTIGHEYAILFSAEFLERYKEHTGYVDGSLYVIVPTRQHEPMARERFWMVYRMTQRIARDAGINIECLWMPWDDAPQSIESSELTAEEFWDTWYHKLLSFLGEDVFTSIRYYFSSESYGNEIAKLLMARHVSIDANRDVVPVKATDVRQRHLRGYEVTYPKLPQNLLPKEVRQSMSKRFVTFGAESVGKTVVGKQLANLLNSRFYPEWARQFLETTKLPCDDQSMREIAFGQTTQEMIAEVYDAPLLSVLDTDILSTIGYYRLSGIHCSDDVMNMMDHRVRWMNDSTHYILLSNDVPFVSDPLRFGGDKRESSTEFWEDLLKEHGCSYTLINSSHYSDRTMGAYYACLSKLRGWFGDLINFEREL